MAEKDKYSKETAESKGYDWQVVSFILHNTPDSSLLDLMWGNSSQLYSSILEGRATKEELNRVLDLTANLGRIGNSAIAAELMLQYLESKAE